MTDAPDRATRLKRLRIRCWRRGTREMDLILGAYADGGADGLDDAGLDALEALLDENDHDLYAWVSGAVAVPGQHAPAVGRLRRFHGIATGPGPALAVQAGKALGASEHRTVDGGRIMAKIGFIGLGNMGLPMAKNLLSAGHGVTGFDLSKAALAALTEAGGTAATDPAGAVSDAEIVVTALPAARHVRGVYCGQGGILDVAARGTVFIDCSTIDVASARAVIAEAGERGQLMIDSPMSGGIGGATAGTLTFMVGGSDAAFAAARPALEAMGRNIFHAGGPGAGSAAKICNNMMLAIQMISVAEGFSLAERLGLDAQKLYDISSTATARCWSLNDYCPAPGPVPTAPSNRGYQPGFSAELMLKDLRIAMEAAQAAGAATPLGAHATQIYSMMDLAGRSDRDFSGVIEFLNGVR